MIENLKPFKGQHCETTATGTLLNQIGLELSEPMLFGLGQGLSFIYWNMKMMSFPFIGGRVKTDLLTKNICCNLNLNLEIKESSSVKKAWQNVVDSLDSGEAVGLKLDSYHLEYFTSKIHFAGHYVAIYGYDKNFAYLVDTVQQGSRAKTSLKSLELARNEKGPMSSRNRSYTIKRSGEIRDLKEAVEQAIEKNTAEYLAPPIKNISYQGIKKAAVEIKKWFQTSNNIQHEFQTSAMLMERAGTGGALFRNLYRDFLKESSDLTKNNNLAEASVEFDAIALLWTRVSELFYKAGESADIQYINLASEILLELSEREKIVMEKLLKTMSALKK
ncbi:MAG: BtrH N-terminal domain-containing protein [Spirochaetales bacterium]|nr:BtrH N-terminal domain-containing protein [Spirochaetales bacterium]